MFRFQVAVIIGGIVFAVWYFREMRKPYIEETNYTARHSHDREFK